MTDPISNHLIKPATPPAPPEKPGDRPPQQEYDPLRGDHTPEEPNEPEGDTVVLHEDTPAEEPVGDDIDTAEISEAARKLAAEEPPEEINKETGLRDYGPGKK